MSEWETRTYGECRIGLADGETGRLEGLAIVFDALSQDLGGFREVIDPAAVDRSLETGADIRALVDHDAAKILGRTRAGTLTLRKEARGLRALIAPDAEISYVRDVMRSVRRGDVSGMSFGFRVPAGGDRWDVRDGVPLRTITDLDLHEVSIVTFPAYPQTDVAQRSLSAAFGSGHRLVWLQQWHRTRLARV